MSGLSGILRGMALATSLFLAGAYVGYRAGVIHFGPKETPVELIDRTMSGSKSDGISLEPPAPQLKHMTLGYDLNVMSSSKSDTVGKNVFVVESPRPNDRNVSEVKEAFAPPSTEAQEQAQKALEPSVRERTMIWGSKSAPIETPKAKPPVQREILPGSKSSGFRTDPPPSAPRAIMGGSKSKMIDFPQPIQAPVQKPQSSESYERQLQSAVRAYSDKEMRDLLEKARAEMQQPAPRRVAPPQQPAPAQRSQQKQTKQRVIIDGSKSGKIRVPAE